MKRLPGIVVLMLLAAAAGPAFAAPVGLGSDGVQEVVVSATRLPDLGFDAHRLPVAATVITEKEIKASGAQSVQEVLQDQPGVVLNDQVGNSFQPTIDLRGFNGQPVPATSVFVDGVRVNQPDFNQTNLDLIPLEDVERIEILPGAAAPFGRDALGGVINIITKRGGATPRVTAETLQGAFGRELYRAVASGPVRKWDYFFDASRESERGFRQESGGKLRRFFGKVGFRPGEKTDLTLSFTHGNDRMSQAGSLPESVLAVDRTANFTPGDFQDNRLSTVVFNGHRKLPGNFSLALNGYFRHLGTESVVFGQTSASRDETTIESQGGTLQITQETYLAARRRNVLTLGAEVNHHDIGNHGASITGFPFLNRRRTKQDSLGVYLQDSFDLSRKVTLTGALRYDRDRLDFNDLITPADSGARTFVRLSPRAGVVYNPLPALGFYYTYSEGFRTPTEDELFAFGAFGSNPDLKPVKSRNHEVGVRTRWGWGEGTLDFFRSDVRDEIYFVCADADCLTGRNENIGKSRRQGIELSLKAHYGDRADGFLNYTFTEATFETDVPSLSARKGNFFPLVPRHRLGGGVNYRPGAGFTLGVSGLYVGSQYMLNDEANDHERLKPYWVFNSRVAYERKVPGGTVTASLLVDNFLNKKYATSGIIASNVLTGGGRVEPFLVPAPGAAAYAKVSYTFEGI